MSFDELLHLIRVGGVTIVVILLASVLSLGVAIERVIALWGVGSQAKALAETIGRHLLKGDLAAARSAADRSNAIAADMFRAGFERAARTTGNSLDAVVDRALKESLLKLKRGFWILGTIGAVTPFVGLFGTVAGIMRSFKELGIDVEAGGTGGPAAVMAGISEALVATAAGILVAVQAVVFYNFFQARLAKLQIELRLIAEEFVELLRDRQSGALQITGPSPTTGEPLPPPAEVKPAAAVPGA